MGLYGPLAGIYNGSGSTTVDSSGNTTVSGNLTVQGTTTAVVNQTVAGSVTITGAADAVQLAVKGFSTQTNAIVRVRNSADADLLTLSGTGALTVAGLLTSQVNLVVGTGEAGATPVGSILRAPNAIGTNIAGAALTIAGGQSTGTGAGGSIVFQTAAAGGAGSGVNALSTRMTVDSAGNVGIGVAPSTYNIELRAASGTFAITESVQGDGLILTGGVQNGTQSILTAAGCSLNVGSSTGGGYSHIAFEGGGAGTGTINFLTGSPQVSRFQISDTGLGTFAAGLTVNGGPLTIQDAQNIVLAGTTGTKLGTATSQKLGFWNTTPIIQPTTAYAAAAFVTNTSLIANDTATFDGYTLGQVVAALRGMGALA